MRIFQLIIIWTTFLGSITFAADDLLTWEKLSELPPVNGQEENPGVAGPFVGIHNDALIIAGGANFPGKPLWETDKVWHDEIYVLVRERGSEGDSYAWKDGGKLLRPLAYGASVSTDKGVLCIGGDDATKVYQEVFLLSWDNEKNELTRRALPGLPDPVAYGAATFVNGIVYLVGGQT
ncbi:MAG: sodium:solute symporter, partial [Verrucomicrobiota bacterium]|nr:sodium:solute symporter [Verrucomicrobiota bacterium]